MAIHEECGVFGILSRKRERLGKLVYYGLYALQHRGQESCGIVVNDDGVFSSYKDLGLVSEVFSEDTLAHLSEGNMAVGHVRYGTTGRNNRKNCQPIEVNHQKGKMALAHNGNLSNALELRDKLELSGAIFHTTSDTETIAYMITRERLTAPSIEEAVSRALTSVGAELIRDLLPGEILVFSEEGVESRREHCGTQKQKTCIFEYIYFARPDSVIDKISVSAARIQAGKLLAQTKPVKADIVIGVPDSGLDAALGFSEVSGIPYGIGLVKNKYIGRTFISPGQKERIDLVRMKLSPIPSVIQGKRVVLIDDSIVRGTTSRQLVSLLREAGAKEIHLRISAPPFLHPCYYGTDIDSEENLIASHHGEKEVATLIGADSLGYLPLECLHELTGTHSYCDACFSGKYATEIPTDVRKDRFEQKLSER